MSRIDEATKRQMSGYNCSQAVACTYCDYAGMDEQTVKNMTKGFGVGLGTTMEGNCGAISGATIILSLVNAKNEEDEMTATRKTMQDTKKLVKRFMDRNQEVTCKKLKGIETGKVLRSCQDCVRDAAEFLEEIIEER